ncbi:MAG: hypothetical protein AABX01_06705 [Candidatus Micrarchaeota archaeon]
MRKKGGFAKTAMVIALLIVIAAISYSIMQNGPASPKPSNVATVSLKPEECLPQTDPVSGKDALEEGAYLKLFPASELDNKDRYDFPKRVFADLPPFPDDLDKVRGDFKAGRLTLGNVKPDYWKQPEFYPNFESAGVELMRNYPTDSHAAFGYGTYPSEYIVTTGADASFEVYFLMRADWGVLNYQGLRLVPAYPSKISALKNAFADGSNSVSQDTGYARCNIRIIGITPGELTLEPAYPTFSAGWAKRVKLSIKTGSGLRPGKYALGIDAISPTDQYNEGMGSILDNRYVTGGGFGTGRPWLMLFIEVKES